ncbi:alpha/beta hydrolase [soil metagenome]
MPLLPGLQPFVDSMPATSDVTIDEADVEATRDFIHQMIDASFRSLGEPGPAVASEVDRAVPVEDGEITVRIYTPDEDGPLPVHVYFHGGAFWLGTLEHSDDNCRRLAVHARCVVVSVDYRLAPGAKFPRPVEDCYSALCWVVDHAAELSIDPSRVSVGGPSAGADLAAVTALMARDRNGPALVFQVLEVPVTDLTMGQPSIEENADGPMLTKAAIAAYVERYLDDPADAQNPYASPMLADDLSGLPPAIVMTAELDPLRDEGEAYARRLVDAGVAVEMHRWPGQFHGSQSMSKLIPDEVAAYHELLVAALVRANTVL